MRRSVKSPERKMREMALKLTGASATLTEGATQATASRASAGAYTLTWKEAYSRIPAVSITARTTACVISCTPSLTGLAIAVTAVDGTTAKDANLDILVLGADVQDAI